MVFFLCGITMKHLYLHPTKIIGNNVAWHKNSLRLEVINLLDAVGVLDLVFQGKVGDTFGMHIPQLLIAALSDSLIIDRPQNINGVFILTK